MLYAVIKNGIVDVLSEMKIQGAISVPVNTIVGSKLNDDGSFEAPPEPAATMTPLNRIQFFAMVELLGKSTQIEAALDAIPDAAQKAVAKAKYKHSSRYDRDDPLFAQLAPAVGLTDAEIDAAWAQALQIV